MYYADNVNDYLKAIEGREEFINKRDEEHGYGVLNYLLNAPDTFPSIQPDDSDEVKRIKILRRNCRGLKYRLRDGKILALTHHKFFNVGEREETLPNNIDWTRPHDILEKLDGSMIHPLIVEDDGPILWCTKMGVTDVVVPVVEFIGKSIGRYNDLARHMLESNKTPIFEWCSRKQQIVVDYPTDKLVLTEIRDNFTGDVSSKETLLAVGAEFNVPVVKHYEIKIGDIHKFLEEIKDDEGDEGRIVKFGLEKYKVKNDWYVNIHRSLETFVFEKDIVTSIVKSTIDDIKPFVPKDLLVCLEKFETDILCNVADIATMIYDVVKEKFEEYKGVKKDFVVQFMKSDEGKKYARYSGPMFSQFDRFSNGNDNKAELVDQILDIVASYCTTGPKLDSGRYWIGDIKWSDYRDSARDLDE